MLTESTYGHQIAGPLGRTAETHCGCRMAKKLNLKESRVIISSQRSLTACRPLGFVGRSMAPIVGRRARGGSYGVGTYPSLHHRDRGPRAAATEWVFGCL